MGVEQQKFNGVATVIPGIYTKSNFPPSLGSIGASTNIVCVIGSCEGGIPYDAATLNENERINTINSVADAGSILLGGDAYYMTEFYLTPSKEPNLNSPAQCIVCRVDPALQSTSTIQDGVSADIIDLTSTKYGNIANQLARKLEAGTTQGKKLTFKFQGQDLSTKDNIYLAYMDIQYIGAATGCAMTISATELTTTAVTTPTDDLVILFSEYSTLDNLVEFINNQPSYTATILGKGDADTTTFDIATAVDIKTAEYTTTAIVESIIQWINTESGGEVTASLHAAAERSPLVNDSNFIFFTAGTNGTISNTDWADAFTLLENFSINHILVASGDPAIHAMASEHVAKMSSILEKKNRSAATGASLATTIKSERIAESKALNDARTEYWITPFYRFDKIKGNVKTEFAPFYGAALSSGIRYGNDITISSTFKTVNILGISESYKRNDLEDYIGNGCSVIDPDDNDLPRVKHNVTSYQSSNKILNLPSALRTADSITLDIQAKLLVFISNQLKAPNAIAISGIENYIVTNLLPGFVDDGRLTDDPNTGDPAFSDIDFKLIGDRFEFRFTGIIPVPLNYIFIKQNFIIPGATTVSA